MNLPTMQNEPIRLPAWVASLAALVILPALSAWLTGTDWRTVLIGVIAAIIPLLGGVEAARAFVTAPANAAPATVAPVVGTPDLATDVATLAGTGPAPDPTNSELARALKHSAQTNPNSSDTPNG